MCESLIVGSISTWPNDRNNCWKYVGLLTSVQRSFKYLLTDWKPCKKGWKSKKEVTLYEECVNWIFGCGLKMTKWTQLFEFHGGGDDMDLDV